MVVAVTSNSVNAPTSMVHLNRLAVGFGGDNGLQGDVIVDLGELTAT